MRMRIAGLAVLVGAGLLAGSVRAGEPTAEALLPVHADRTPTRLCGLWEGHLPRRLAIRAASPWDLREGIKFNGDIVGCRVSKDGKVLDAAPLVLCGAADLQEQPQAAYSGAMFLVVWQTSATARTGTCMARAFSPGGKVLDPDGILVSGGAHNQALPRVAWDGKTFLVVWQDFRSTDHYEIFGARVGTDGKVLDPQGVVHIRRQG